MPSIEKMSDHDESFSQSSNPIDASERRFIDHGKHFVEQSFTVLADGLDAVKASKLIKDLIEKGEPHHPVQREDRQTYTIYGKR